MLCLVGIVNKYINKIKYFNILRIVFLSENFLDYPIWKIQVVKYFEEWLSKFSKTLFF